MYDQNVIVHKVVAGDNLYRIAQMYKTAVDGILAANPYLDPYHLKIGDEIIIYPGRDGLASDTFTPSQVELMDRVRLLLEQHAIWTRMMAISISDNLRDTDDIAKRLTKWVNEVGAGLNTYYGDDISKRISGLLMNHLVIAHKLFITMRQNDKATYEQLDKAWYKNADDIAFALSSINPYYVERNIREMFYKYLDFIKSQANNRLSANYAADITAFDNAEQQALMIADNLTDGIINQFPHKFS